MTGWSAIHEDVDALVNKRPWSKTTMVDAETGEEVL